MVTESPAQYQQTGNCRMALISDAAQPTHPISSAEDVDMQPNPATPRPDMHDIATPRRSIGGRCSRWVVSTQDPSQSNKRKCAACTVCSRQFTPGEPRLQQCAKVGQPRRTTSLRTCPLRLRRPSGPLRADTQDTSRPRSERLRHPPKRQKTQSSRRRRGGFTYSRPTRR